MSMRLPSSRLLEQSFTYPKEMTKNEGLPATTSHWTNGAMPPDTVEITPDLLPEGQLSPQESFSDIFQWLDSLPAGTHNVSDSTLLFPPLEQNMPSCVSPQVLNLNPFTSKRTQEHLNQARSHSPEGEVTPLAQASPRHTAKGKRKEREADETNSSILRKQKKKKLEQREKNRRAAAAMRERRRTWTEDTIQWGNEVGRLLCQVQGYLGNILPPSENARVAQVNLIAAIDKVLEKQLKILKTRPGVKLATSPNDASAQYPHG